MKIEIIRVRISGWAIRRGDLWAGYDGCWGDYEHARVFRRQAQAERFRNFLSGIIAMNNRVERAARKAETETSRHCSYTQDGVHGIVLHSALHRNTVYIQPGDNAVRFLNQVEACEKQADLDYLIESYF